MLRKHKTLADMVSSFQIKDKGNPLPFRSLRSAGESLTGPSSVYIYLWSAQSFVRRSFVKLSPRRGGFVELFISCKMSGFYIRGRCNTTDRLLFDSSFL